jgi:hypothetical protein
MLDRSRFPDVLRAVRRRARRAQVRVLRAWRDPARRERITAKATCALIAALTLGALDYLIAGGGPDWNPVGAAYAMEAPAPRPALATAPVILVEAPPALLAAKLDRTDYSVTAEELLGGPVAVTEAFAPAFAFEATSSRAALATPNSGMDWR